MGYQDEDLAVTREGSNVEAGQGATVGAHVGDRVGGVEEDAGGAQTGS